MSHHRAPLRNIPLLAASISCLLLTLLAPGWRGLLRALDYSSLANCALPFALNLTARVGDQPSTHTIYVAHNLIAGCDVASAEPYTASVTYYNGGESWLSVTPTSGNLQPLVRNAVRVTVTPATLPGAGTYQGFVHVRVPRINGTITVPVNVAIVPPVAELSLSAPSMIFQAVTQTGVPRAQTLTVANTGTGTLDWTLDSAALPSWLNITPRAGNIPTGGTPVALTVTPTTIGLPTNVYAALIPFRSSTARNSPQYLQVTYHVVAPTAGATPLFNTYSLVGRAPAGGSFGVQRTLTVSNIGGASFTATFAAATSSGNWLSVSPTSATVTSSTPVTVGVNMSPTGLTAGVYRGTITGTFSARQPQTVDVVFVVTPSGTAYGISPTSGDRSGLDGCTPTSMFLVGNTVGSGVNAPVSFPQTILAQLLDSCAEPVANATVMATIGGVNNPMSNAGGGLYTGTWTPTQAAANVGVTLTAFHPSFASVQQSFTVSAITASGGTTLPVVFNEGVVDGAAFVSRRPLMPGGIISLFGANLASSTQAASTIPLERRLAQTSVRVGNVDAPLYFVSPGQINAQVPFESRPGEVASVVVSVDGRLSAPQNYLIAPAQPGIFTDSLGPAVLDSEFRRITPANPARIGSIIQMFVGGLGDTNPAVATGGTLNVASDATVPVNVQIGDLQAPVQYNGLAPGFVGLYQVNVTVPNVTPGGAVPIVLRQNGVPANPNQSVTIPVAQ